jgi:Lactonase, 7-bladed beta-propeller
MFRISQWIWVFVIVLGVVTMSAAGPTEEGRLKLVESLCREELDSVAKAVLSPDGRFVYACSWKLARVLTFARDSQTGKLELRQTIVDADNLEGVTGLALSLDGNLVIATAFRSRTAVLYLRNPENGLLTRLNTAREGEGGVRMGFPIEAAFSPDSKYVCVLDEAGIEEEGSGAVVSFRVEHAKLVVVGTDLSRPKTKRPSPSSVADRAIRSSINLQRRTLRLSGAR